MVEVIRLKAPGGSEQLVSAEIELAPPGPDEVRIRQTAIGVNFIDIYQRQGLYHLPQAIPGVEGVGVITAIGDNVSSKRLGERIAYAGAPVGAYAAERNLPAWRAVTIPAALTDKAVASTFLKGLTAQMLLHRVYPVGADDTVLIHSAAGGLGQLLVRWASHLDATVIGTVGSDAKAEVAREAGAHQVIIGRDADFAAEVAALTAGRRADYAIDGVGGTTLAKTLACVRPFGVVASIGQSAGRIPPITVEELGPQRSLMLGRPSAMGYVNSREDYQTAAEAVLSLVEQGVLAATAKPYALHDAAQAHADLEAGRTTGSVVLVPS
ncbi:quinone oxidoreductase [Rhodopseudomonas palustris]|uniref:quinone oxidoreductase family protein n=1 Tax=Rhodopseudomonas palustris TaxID=1076 RepID=UPI0020CD01F0|nr:quinone oxidoreductase [Rhodopseudomonas palustris]MCP9628739.1 quinone oxidoreductase [Rhodopseudomonas palustris]